MVFTSRNPHQLWSSSLGIRINSGFAFHGAASTLGITVQASARARSLSPMSLSLPHLSLSPSLPPLLPPPPLAGSLSLSLSFSLPFSLRQSTNSSHSFARVNALGTFLCIFSVPFDDEDRSEQKYFLRAIIFTNFKYNNIYKIGQYVKKWPILSLYFFNFVFSTVTSK